MDSKAASRIDLNALILFYETVNLRSINKASVALSMPKSTISRRLKLLEQQFGSTLLKRGTRSLSLTETEQTLYERCERIVGEIEKANLQTARMQDEMSGVLRVAMPTFLIGWASESIARFAKAHPALSQPGELLISYNINSFDFSKDIKKFPHLYRPRFIKLKYK